LVAFSKVFDGLQTDGNKDKAAWSWREKSQLLDLPGMSPSVALSFQMTKQFLNMMMPESVKQSLNPYFEQSNKIIKEIKGDNYFEGWVKKIRIIPRTQNLLEAKVSLDVLQVVYQALLEDKAIVTKYQPKDNKEEKEYVMHPQGLVLRHNIIYLVATLWNYKDLKHFSLHRIKECKISDSEYNKIDDFNLDDYIATGSFDYTDSNPKEIKLTAIFEKDTAFHLTETPLSKDQTIVKKHDGRIQVTAIVKNSSQLRWWLLGFGGNVEVVKPKALRDEFIQTSKKITKIYTSDPKINIQQG